MSDRRSEHTGRRIGTFYPTAEPADRDAAIQLLLEYADAVDRPFCPERWPGEGGDADDIAWLAYLATTDAEHGVIGAERLDVLEAAARLREGCALALAAPKWQIPVESRVRFPLGQK